MTNNLFEPITDVIKLEWISGNHNIDSKWRFKVCLYWSNILLLYEITIHNFGIGSNDIIDIIGTGNNKHWAVIDASSNNAL